MSSIGTELRSLRTARGLTISAVAERTALSKSTWANWESGHRSPEGSTLDFALGALEVEDRERVRLLSEADPSYAGQALADHPIGPRVPSGSILRSLRLRAKMTQGQLAKRAGLTQGAIAKWESGESVPDPEKIRRVAKMAGASKAELELLRHSPSKPTDPEGLQQTIFHQNSIYNPVPFPARELCYLAAQDDAWKVAVHTGENANLVEAIGGLSVWYFLMERYGEAEAFAKQALRLSEEQQNWNEASSAVETMMMLGRHSSDPTTTGELGDFWLARISEPKRIANVGINLMKIGMDLNHGSEAIDLGRFLIDTLSGAPQAEIDPFFCEEHIRDAMAEVYLEVFGSPEKALEVMMPLPSANEDPLRQILRRSPMFYKALRQMDQPLPANVLDALKRRAEYMPNEPHNLAFSQRTYRAALRFQEKFG